MRMYIGLLRANLLFIIRWDSQLLIGPCWSIRPWEMTLKRRWSVYYEMVAFLSQWSSILMQFRLTSTASGSCHMCHRIQNHMAPLSSSAWNFWFLVSWGGCLYWGSIWGTPPALKHDRQKDYRYVCQIEWLMAKEKHGIKNDDTCC